MARQTTYGIKIKYRDIKRFLNQTQVENGYVCLFTWSDRLIQYEEKQYAVFGDKTEQLLSIDRWEGDKQEFEYQPVIFNGRMLRQSINNEWNSLLYVIRTIKDKGTPRPDAAWELIFIRSSGWLSLDEIQTEKTCEAF